MRRRDCLNFPDPVLAENLRKMVFEEGITQSEIARVCGKERKAAVNWCNEYTSPSAWDLKQICIHFNLSADYMLGLCDYDETDDNI